MKKVVIFVVGVLTLVAVVTFVYSGWYNSLERRGINVDWNDPWTYDGEKHYYVEWITENGEKMSRWLLEDVAVYMAMEREKGNIVYPGHWK